LLVGDSGEQTLVDVVHDRILLEIIRGDRPSGSELKSTQIASALQVSRTPVVQGLARLIAEGIVTQQTNHRAIVRAGAENWLVDVHKLRQQLEPVAAKSAAGQISERVMVELEQLAAETPALPRHQWRAVNRHFDYALHLVVAEFCGNLAVRDTIRRCWMYKHVAYDAMTDSDEYLRRGFDEHVAILGCLKSGDGPGASRAMQDHLREAAHYRVHQRIL